MASSLVSVSSLHVQFSKDHFKFKSTEELVHLTDSIGQERALEAMNFAVTIDSWDYNAFVLGESGLGKHDIVRKFLEEKSSSKEAPGDWIYVYNFANPDQPIAIILPPGQAKEFQSLMVQFIEDLRTTIPSIYESERYRNRRDNLIKEFKDLQDKAIAELQDRAKKEHVYLLNLRGNLIFAQGDKSGNLIDDDALAKLTQEEQKNIRERLLRFNDELLVVVNQFPILERQLRSTLKEFSREMIAVAVETLSKDLKSRYNPQLKIKTYLEDVTKDIIENSRFFRRSQDDHVDLFERLPSPLKRYQINILVDQAKILGGPVVYEDNPTFMNLVGQIEHISQMGALVTDFSLIKPGALHRANGGYLILDAFKLLTSPYAWEGLKRSLKSRSICIESLGQVFSLISTVSLKPEPIPLNCRVLIIGDREIYQLLTRFDPEFSSLFRVAADFTDVMKRDDKNETSFMRLIATELKKNDLLPMSLDSAINVLKFAVRLAQDRDKISINLDLIINLLKESHFFAQQSQGQLIEGEHVQQAIAAQKRRLSLPYENVLDEFASGTVLLDVTGWSVGQVNGLSVFEIGDFFFGRGCRITATVRMGEGNVIDIEREAKLGGAIHSKGVLILSGFLRSFYASDVPLSISASIVFEQSYGAIDGDSASLAELCALLSALSQLEMRQSFAITGSINQHGEVQPVGAINEKIEGFFDLCQLKGLTGEQGVVIPRSNLKHLALRDDVISAATKNLFSIHAVDNVHDCMQLLTGLPSRTITEKIENRLRSFSQQIQKMNNPPSRSSISNLEPREMSASDK